MSAIGQASLAVRARRELVDELAEAGLEATGDAGAFYPQPVGILVGLPTLVSRGLAFRVFTIPVLIVSGDPLNSDDRVAAVYELADQVALELGTAAYRPTQYRSTSNAEPLPAVEVLVTVTITEGG